MTRSDIFDRIAVLLQARFGVAAAALSEDRHFAGHLDMGWLERVPLVLEVEEVFGIEISDDDLIDLQTVGQLVDLVAERIGGFPGEAGEVPEASAALPARQEA